MDALIVLGVLVLLVAVPVIIGIYMAKKGLHKAEEDTREGIGRKIGSSLPAVSTNKIKINGKKVELTKNRRGKVSVSRSNQRDMDYYETGVDAIDAVAAGVMIMDQLEGPCNPTPYEEPIPSPSYESSSSSYDGGCGFGGGGGFDSGGFDGGGGCD